MAEQRVDTPAETMKDNTLRGFDALFHSLESTGRRGGGRTAGGNSPVNISIALLRACERPMNAKELTGHAMGLGLWTSEAANPVASFIHPVSDECKKFGVDGTERECKIVKPRPGYHAAVKGGVVLAIIQTPVDPQFAKLYQAAIVAGRLPKIDVSKLPIAKV